MEFNNRKNKIADVVTLIMPLLLILSEVLQTPSPFYAALAISILSLRHPFVIFPAYFVASLSSTYFSPVEGLGASRIFSLVLIVSLLFSKDSFKKTNGYKDIGILCVVLIVFNAFSSLISISGSFFTFFVMLQNLLVLYFLQRQNNVDIERLSLMLFWSSVIVLLGILYEVSLSGIAVDTTERYTVESTNENNFAMMCAQLGTVMVSFMFIKKELIHRLVALVLVLGCVIVIFLSGSRSSLLGLLCSAALLALISFRGNTLRTIVLAIIFVVPIYLIYNYAVDAESYLLQRFTLQSVADTGGSGRMAIMKRIFGEIVPNYFFFGVGLGGINIMAAGLPKPCHNIIIDPLSQIGIIGIILYWRMIIPVISKTLKLISRNQIVFLPLALFFTALFNGIGETIFYEKFFWNSIALCALYSNVINKQ